MRPIRALTKLAAMLFFWIVSCVMSFIFYHKVHVPKHKFKILLLLLLFSGSTNFVIIAVLTIILKGTWHFRQVKPFMFLKSPVFFWKHIYSYWKVANPMTVNFSRICILVS